MNQLQMARPKPQETKITKIGKAGLVFVPAHVAIVGCLTMIQPDETWANLQQTTVAIVQPTRLKAESEDAGWDELERMALSGEQLDALAEYFRSTGQASA